MSSARDAAASIVRTLREAGHVAYFAGGCVRDRLLGLEPKDYDAATDARPEKVRELFRQSRYVGEAFGVVLVRVQHHGVEVATFRNEWGYEDGRRPSEVHFTDAEHDAQRRDFTINGLFEDPFAADPSRAVIDYVRGQADLKAKVLRAIGDPEERFAEDYLRMLRAVRFAARLDFTIDPATAQAIRRRADKLALISRERIGQECQWMLGPGVEGRPTFPAKAIGLIEGLDLDAAVLDEPHREAAGHPLVSAVAHAPYSAVLAAWLVERHFNPAPSRGEHPAEETIGAVAAFCQDTAPGHLRRWRAALCLSNEQRDELEGIFRHLPRALEWSELPIAKRKRLLAQPTWPLFWALLRAMAGPFGLGALIQTIAAGAEALKREGVAPPPLITGDDLVAAGRRPGPAFKSLLDRAYDLQLEHKLTTREQALDWARQQG